MNRRACHFVFPAWSCLPFGAGLVFGGMLCAEPLTQADRQALIEQLDALRGEAGRTASQRLDGAAADFAAAMKSNEAATTLYVKCVEKVDFEERDRKAADFREWKRRHKDRLADGGHAVALRHQLRWMVLTMKAAGAPEGKLELAPELLAALEAIYRTPEELRGHVEMLAQPVNATVFARAYGLTGYEVEGWPMAPLQGKGGGIRVEGPFDLVIFPSLRVEKAHDALRDAWRRRIQFEEVARGFWAEDSDGEGQSRARERFLADGRPQLIWGMEEDLFRSGDERRAALALLKHLEQHIGHSQARGWEARFRELVDPPAPSTSAVPAEAR